MKSVHLFCKDDQIHNMSLCVDVLVRQSVVDVNSRLLSPAKPPPLALAKGLLTQHLLLEFLSSAFLLMFSISEEASAVVDGRCQTMRNVCSSTFEIFS